MSCQEFQSFVKKEFAFLFEEYGFSIIHTEEAKTRSDHCIIGLGSSILMCNKRSSVHCGSRQIGDLPSVTAFSGMIASACCRWFQRRWDQR